MRILGIDPGVATVGFGVIDSAGSKQTLVTYGTVETEAGVSLTHRLDRIYSDVTELITRFNPDSVAVEELFFNTNQKTGITVAQGRGVILLAAFRSGVQVYEYTPLQVKQSVVGYGRAEKRQVQDMTRLLLRLTACPKPDDVADALAIAICHAHSNNSLLRML